MALKRISKTSIVFLLIIGCLATALGAVWMQKSVTNTMTLNGNYDFALYETTTTTPISAIAWGAFNESRAKTYVLDLKYLGNTEGKVYWDTTVPTGWTLTVRRGKVGQTLNSWLSGESKNIFVSVGDTLNIEFTLTETTATPVTPYSFAVTFYSIT